VKGKKDRRLGKSANAQGRGTSPRPLDKLEIGRRILGRVCPHYVEYASSMLVSLENRNSPGGVNLASGLFVFYKISRC